jgi:hypothetical protein
MHDIESGLYCQQERYRIDLLFMGKSYSRCSRTLDNHAYKKQIIAYYDVLIILTTSQLYTHGTEHVLLV